MSLLRAHSTCEGDNCNKQYISVVFNPAFFLFQAFLSELYVYLVDQMHVGLNKVLSVEDQAPVPEPLTDSAQLKHFAREAEVNENYELAAKYYQEVREFNGKVDRVFCRA